MKSKIDLERVLQEKQKLLNQSSLSSDNKLEYLSKEVICNLLDSNSFVEMYSLLSNESKSSGLVAGFGTISNRPVYMIMQEQALHYGAVSQLQSLKFTKLVNSSLETGAPIVLVLNSAGVFLEDGIKTMHAFSEMYSSLTKASGICPLICLINGNCYGGNALLSQLCDFIITINNKSQISLFGPQVLSAYKGPDTSLENTLSIINSKNKELSSIVCESLDEAIAAVKSILSYLPDNNSAVPEESVCSNLNKLVNINSNSSKYDVLSSISDANSFIELYKNIDSSLLIALSRIGGHSSLLIITDSCDKNTIGYTALQKLSKLISVADSFNIPIVSLINSNGVSLLSAEEQSKLIEAQANMIHNFASTTVGKISIIYGKAIGEVYASIASKSLNDVVYAYPDAIISALEPEAAIQVLWENKIKSNKSPIETAKKELANDYVEEFASSIVAAKDGLVDDIIDPEYTRMHIIYALEMLASKNVLEYSRKHGNLPK